MLSRVTAKNVGDVFFMMRTVVSVSVIRYRHCILIVITCAVLCRRTHHWLYGRCCQTWRSPKYMLSWRAGLQRSLAATWQLTYFWTSMLLNMFVCNRLLPLLV